jgi:hypothetical protein
VLLFARESIMLGAMGEPTPYKDLNAVLNQLVSSIQETLGDSFVGAYLQGSFAIGDFDFHSDVDFVVVVEEALSDAQVEALQAVHERIFQVRSSWAKHLEGSYFPSAVLRDNNRRGEPLWYLDNGSRSLVLSNHCNTLVVRSTLARHGVTMSGPAVETLLAPPPVLDLQQEIFDVITWWAAEIEAEPGRFANRFYQGFIVLSYCRMLHDLRTGSLGSKRAGADWAKLALNPAWRDLIDRAWHGRPRPELSVQKPADTRDFEQTRRFVQYVTGLSNDFAKKNGLAPGKTVRP